MSESTPFLTDADFDALLASGSTMAPATMTAPAADALGQRLETVAEILSRLPSLPLEASLICADLAGKVDATRLGDSLVVGRSSTCGLICGANTGLSKKHFEVFRKDGGYFLRDLNSKNGTSTNNCTCTPGELRHLIDGDVILAGGSTFIFLA